MLLPEQTDEVRYLVLRPSYLFLWSNVAYSLPQGAEHWPYTGNYDGLAHGNARILVTARCMMPLAKASKTQVGLWIWTANTSGHWLSGGTICGQSSKITDCCYVNACKHKNQERKFCLRLLVNLLSWAPWSSISAHQIKWVELSQPKLKPTWELYSLLP